jgi:hypothetical protein
MLRDHQFLVRRHDEEHNPALRQRNDDLFVGESVKAVASDAINPTLASWRHLPACRRENR